MKLENKYFLGFHGRLGFLGDKSELGDVLNELVELLMEQVSCLVLRSFFLFQTSHSAFKLFDLVILQSDVLFLALVLLEFLLQLLNTPVYFQLQLAHLLSQLLVLANKRFVVRVSFERLGDFILHFETLFCHLANHKVVSIDSFRKLGLVVLDCFVELLYL